MNAFSEPTPTALDEPESDDMDDDDAVFTHALDTVAARAVEFVREQAAEEDWLHADFFATVPAWRITDAAYVAEDLLLANLQLRRRYGRAGRTGRREHMQRVYELLDETNPAT